MPYLLAKVHTVFDVDTRNGLLSPARQLPSDNCDERPDGAIPQIIVLHGISLPPGEFGGRHIEAFFTNKLDHDEHPYFDEIRGLTVSSHLLIRRDGDVVQFVPFTKRAWHAGESCYRGRERCNDYSIGIELEGEDQTRYDDRQYPVLTAVVAALKQAYPDISNRDLVGHCDVAPGRKTDPGPAFDWLRLYDGLR